ncbi:MAG TPA: hypothetical protein PKC24_07970 [Cyclobacteriaceae bacterium]|nr:hypothetical protein [Cyclobacteriaceae bacterium]
MLRFVTHTLLIALLYLILQYMLPWWSLAIAASLVGFFLSVNGARAFFAGFLGIGLFWLLMAILIDWSTQSGLGERVAAIFSVSKPILLILTAFIGAIVGGCAALTGYYLRKAFW